MSAENQKTNARQETKPRRYLLQVERTHPTFHVESIVVSDDSFSSPQEFAEVWFQDPAIIRIYELVQLYAIGKVRGQ